MEFAEGSVSFYPFLTITFGIIVLLFGKRINDSFSFLKDFNIPDSVTGGLIFSLLFFLFFLLSGIQLEFDLVIRDFLLVYFFTSIGINTSLHDMIRGGKPLIILLLITTAFIFLQNLIGLTIASLFSLPKTFGLLVGSMSLTGGHGTTVAWAPEIARAFGISNTMEIGMAGATFGLLLASLLGGPAAKFLISRYNLKPDNKKTLDVGVSSEDQDCKFNYLDLLDAVLAIHFCIVIGYLLNKLLAYWGVFVPLFVPCLFTGIILTNTIPKSFPRIYSKGWPSGTPAMALIADISLGTFLSMSLMSMQLWTLASLAGPLLTILAAQFILTIITIFFVVFPLLGQKYDAAVISAGFGGYALGSTANAMANMAAVSHRYGPSHLAFIIVPLICAVFINFANAIMIPVFLFKL